MPPRGEIAIPVLRILANAARLSIEGMERPPTAGSIPFDQARGPKIRRWSIERGPMHRESGRNLDGLICMRVPALKGGAAPPFLEYVVPGASCITGMLLRLTWVIW